MREGEETDDSSLIYRGVFPNFGAPARRRHGLWKSRRCEETEVDDPEARAETLWAVRRAVARTLTDEDENGRTLRQLLFIARGRAEENFDRVYGPW